MCCATGVCMTMLARLDELPVGEAEVEYVGITTNSKLRIIAQYSFSGHKALSNDTTYNVHVGAMAFIRIYMEVLILGVILWYKAVSYGRERVNFEDNSYINPLSAAQQQWPTEGATSHDLHMTGM